MLPEQIWDADDIPRYQLYNGHPAGSGMPLAWAHAEYVKLLRSREEGKVYDMPPQPVVRYQKDRTTADFQIWTEQEPRQWISAGKNLRVDFNKQKTLSWSIDDGTVTESVTRPPLLGRHTIEIVLPPQWRKLNIRCGTDGTTLRLQCLEASAEKS